jgi:uncharacterized protein YceK
MKKTLITIAVLALLAGCASTSGLSVNCDASYRSDVPLGQRK